MKIASSVAEIAVCSGCGSVWHQNDMAAHSTKSGMQVYCPECWWKKRDADSGKSGAVKSKESA